MSNSLNGTQPRQTFELEDFERQARGLLDHQSQDLQITSLIHLVYHTLDCAKAQRGFIVDLEVMKKFDLEGPT